MPSLMQLRNYNIKVIFLVHFVFIALSCIGYWSPSSYLFYNVILIFLLLWSIYNDQQHEPLQLAIAVNGISIVLDVLVLVFRFPSNGGAGDKFSVAMAILHLIVRPISTLFLVRNLEERSGSPGVLSDLIVPGRSNADSYEDIEGGPQQSEQKASGGYSFSSAQEI